MTEEQEKQIRRMTGDGISQKKIGRTFGLSRGTVHRFQKRSGLSLRRHGPRCPELTAEQKAKALEMLRGGIGTLKTAGVVGAREWAIRKIKEANDIPGSGAKLTPRQLLDLRADILGCREHAATLAARHHVPYKTVLKLAKQFLGVNRLRPGRGRPLDSPFPLRPRTFERLAEVLMTDHRPGVSAEILCDAAMRAIPALSEADPGAKKLFEKNLVVALRAQMAMRNVPANAWLN